MSKRRDHDVSFKARVALELPLVEVTAVAGWVWPKWSSMPPPLISREASASSAISAPGAEVRLRGYSGERLVTSQLVSGGHAVSLPETSNMPGFDLFVDGLSVWVRCGLDHPFCPNISRATEITR